jgi:dolichyl-phosphate-mannose--protein O-mannosyl transferase
MLKLQKSVIADHPYKSKWYTWPFMIRPIWYEFIKDSTSNYFRGVILLGNPVQMLLGIFGVIYLTCKTFVNRIQKYELYFLTLFLFSWLVWALVPRGLQFFYYFFVPASLYVILIPLFMKNLISTKKLNLFLSFTVILSLGVFIYFYPVISGNFAPEVVRLKWAWFNSWI